MEEHIDENMDTTIINNDYNEVEALEILRLETINKFPIIIKECFGNFTHYGYYDNNIIFEDIIKSLRDIFDIQSDIMFDIVVGGTDDMEYSYNIVTTIEKIKTCKTLYIRYKKYTDFECLNCHNIKYEIKRWNAVKCEHLYCGECFMKCRKSFKRCPFCI